MTSFETNRKVRNTIKVLERVLDDVSIRSLIDEPVDRALSQFREDRLLQPIHQSIRETLLEFVRFVYVNGLRYPWVVADEVSSAISLVERRYSDNHASGFVEALWDAHVLEGEWGFILGRLAEVVKSLERDKYRQAMLMRYCSDLDWEMKKYLASELRNRMAGVLPMHLGRCRIEQLAHSVPELIMLYVDTFNSLNGLLRQTFVTTENTTSIIPL